MGAYRHLIPGALLEKGAENGAVVGGLRSAHGEFCVASRVTGAVR